MKGVCISYVATHIVPKQSTDRNVRSSIHKNFDPHSIIKMAARGPTWRDSEVDALINVWSNETIQTQLRGPYRNEPIYRKIEEELRKRGIVRGWKQCRDKLKTLQAPHIPSPGRSWRCFRSEPTPLSHSHTRSHSPGHDARTPASFPRFCFPLIPSQP